VRCVTQEKRTVFKKAVAAIVLGGLLIASPAGFSHDDPKPRHGGIVQVVNDVSYELVIRDAGVDIHVSDHGKPMSTAGMTGKLTVMVGAQRSDVDLVAAGDKLEAKGVKLAKGAKLVAALALPNKKAVTVRFAIK
jgi:hypothetical protein